MWISNAALVFNLLLTYCLVPGVILKHSALQVYFATFVQGNTNYAHSEFLVSHGNCAVVVISDLVQMFVVEHVIDRHLLSSVVYTQLIFIHAVPLCSKGRRDLATQRACFQVCLLFAFWAYRPVYISAPSDSSALDPAGFTVAWQQRHLSACVNSMWHSPLLARLCLLRISTLSWQLQTCVCTTANVSIYIHRAFSVWEWALKGGRVKLRHVECVANGVRHAGELEINIAAFLEAFRMPVLFAFFLCGDA